MATWTVVGVGRIVEGMCRNQPSEKDGDFKFPSSSRDASPVGRSLTIRPSPTRRINSCKLLLCHSRIPYPQSCSHCSHTPSPTQQHPEDDGGDDVEEDGEWELGREDAAEDHCEGGARGVGDQEGRGRRLWKKIQHLEICR